MITRKFLNSVLRIPDDPVPPQIYIDAPSHPKPHTKIIIDEYTGHIPFGEVIKPRNTSKLTSKLTSKFKYQGYREIRVEIKGVSGTITSADVNGYDAFPNKNDLNGVSDKIVLIPAPAEGFPYGTRRLTINYNDDLSGNPNTLTLDVNIAPFKINFNATQINLEEKYNIKCEIADLYERHKKPDYINKVNKMFSETVIKWDLDVVKANCDFSTAVLSDPNYIKTSKALSEIKAAHKGKKKFLDTQKINDYLKNSETIGVSFFKSRLKTVKGTDELFNKLSDNHTTVINYMMDKQNAHKNEALQTCNALIEKYEVIKKLELINKGSTIFNTQILNLKNDLTKLDGEKTFLTKLSFTDDKVITINYQDTFKALSGELSSIESVLTTNTESVIKFMNGEPQNAYSEKLNGPITKIDDDLVNKINEIRQTAVTAAKKKIKEAIARGNALKTNIATLKAIVREIVRLYNPNTTIFPLPTDTDLDAVNVSIDDKIDKLQAFDLTENNFNPKLNYGALITGMEPKYDDKVIHETLITTYLEDELSIEADLYEGNIVTKITEANIQKAKTLLEKQQELLETLKQVVPKINKLKFIKEKNEARSKGNNADSVIKSDVLDPADLTEIDTKITAIKLILDKDDKTDDGTAQIKKLNDIIPDTVKNPINKYLTSIEYEQHTVDSEKFNKLDELLTEEIKNQQEIFNEQDIQRRDKIRLRIKIKLNINRVNKTYIGKIKNIITSLNEKITEYNTNKISETNILIVEPDIFVNSTQNELDGFKSETRKKVLNWTNDIQSKVISPITNRSDDTSDLVNALTTAINAYKSTELTAADSEKTELDKFVSAVNALVNSLISDIDKMIKEAALQLAAKQLEVNTLQGTISDINEEVNKYNEQSIKKPIDPIKETVLTTGGSTNQENFKNYTEYLTSNNISDPSTTVVSFINQIKGKGNDEKTLTEVVVKQIELDELELQNKQQELKLAKNELQADRKALKSYVEKSIYFDNLQIEDPDLNSGAQTKREQYIEVQENITKIKNLNQNVLKNTISAKHANQSWSNFTDACDGASTLEENELQQVRTTADGLKEEAANSIKRYLYGTSSTLIEYGATTLQVNVPRPKIDKTDSNKNKYEKYVQYKQDIETRIKEIKTTIVDKVKEFTSVVDFTLDSPTATINDFINAFIEVETLFLTKLKKEANKLMEQFKINKAALKRFTDVTADSNLRQLKFSDELNNKVQSLVKIMEKIEEESKKDDVQSLSSLSLPNNPSRYSKEEFKAYKEIIKLLGPNEDNKTYISEIKSKLFDKGYSNLVNFQINLEEITLKEERKKQEEAAEAAAEAAAAAEKERKRQEEEAERLRIIKQQEEAEAEKKEEEAAEAAAAAEKERKEKERKEKAVAAAEAEKKKQQSLEERKKQENQPKRKPGLPAIKNPPRISTPQTEPQTGDIPLTPGSETGFSTPDNYDRKNVINVTGKSPSSPSSTSSTSPFQYAFIRREEQTKETEKKDQTEQTAGPEEDVYKILKDAYTVNVKKINVKKNFKKMNTRENYNVGDFVKLVRFKDIHYGWIIEKLRLPENENIEAKQNTDTVSILSLSGDVFVKKTFPWHDGNNYYQISKYKLKQKQSNKINDYLDKERDTTLNEDYIFEGTIKEVKVANREYTIGQKIEELETETGWKIATWGTIPGKGALVKFKYENIEVIGCVFSKINGVIKMVVYQYKNDETKKNDVYHIKFENFYGNRATKINFTSPVFILYIPKKEIAETISNAVFGYAEMYENVRPTLISVSYPGNTPQKNVEGDIEVVSVGGNTPPPQQPSSSEKSQQPSSPPSPPPSPDGKFRPRMQMSPRRAPQVLDVDSSMQLRF